MASLCGGGLPMLISPDRFMLRFLLLTHQEPPPKALPCSACPFFELRSWTEQQLRHDGGFGSPGAPQGFWSRTVSPSRPQTACTQSSGGQSPATVTPTGLLDRGAGVTLLARDSWAPTRPTETLGMGAVALGGSTQAGVAAAPILIPSPEGQQATVTPRRRPRGRHHHPLLPPRLSLHPPRGDGRALRLPGADPEPGQVPGGRTQPAGVLQPDPLLQEPLQGAGDPRHPLPKIPGACTAPPGGRMMMGKGHRSEGQGRRERAGAGKKRPGAKESEGRAAAVLDRQREPRGGGHRARRRCNTGTMRGAEGASSGSNSRPQKSV
ncbi:uncharacterized protein LOC141972375 isoform X1 [Athene noctua]|uniref:uncharacterized protein LOC141972375 isoform X1 n=1 Tax=Athene noctua TaxID=126797 RepID=UPI003EBBB81F